MPEQFYTGHLMRQERQSPDCQVLSYSNWQMFAAALCFFSLGFATAAWVPLIPLLQKTLLLSHTSFGMLLLGAGVGSMLAMPIAARCADRWGCRVVIACALAGLILIVPILASMNEFWLLVLSLVGFGASAGALGVTVNFQATQLEKKYKKNHMSLLHGICSLGGLLGVASMTGLLSFGVGALNSALLISLVVFLIAMLAIPFCLKKTMISSTETENAPKKNSRINPTILGIGLICFIAFLSEGAAMDWSGIYLHDEFSVALTQTGWAYTCFAALMMIGRFSGHWIIRFLGEKQTVLCSAILAGAGLFTVVFAPIWQVVLLGYAMLGLGSANIVPLMFSFTARQKQMPSHQALATVSVLAYTGSLCGPALVGFLSEWFGLSSVFVCIALALVLIALFNPLSQSDAIQTHATSEQTPA